MNPECFENMRRMEKSLVFWVYKFKTLFCQRAEFFPVGRFCQKHCNPVFFVHVPRRKNRDFVCDFWNYFGIGFQVYGKNLFIAREPEPGKFYLDNKGEPFFVFAAEHCVFRRVWPWIVAFAAKFILNKVHVFFLCVRSLAALGAEKFNNFTNLISYFAYKTSVCIFYIEQNVTLIWAGFKNFSGKKVSFQFDYWIKIAVQNVFSAKIRAVFFFKAKFRKFSGKIFDVFRMYE